MKFYSLTNPAPRKATCSGKKEIDDYEVRFDKSGVKKLVKKSTKKNIYDRIQANKEASEIYTIIEHCDPKFKKEIISIKAATNSEVYDLTKMPENLIQAKQMQIDAEENWKKLPIELRKEFNHNPNEFMASMQNGSFKSRYEKVYPQKSKKVETTTTTETKNEKETL